MPLDRKLPPECPNLRFEITTIGRNVGNVRSCESSHRENPLEVANLATIRRAPIEAHNAAETAAKGRLAMGKVVRGGPQTADMSSSCARPANRERDSARPKSSCTAACPYVGLQSVASLDCAIGRQGLKDAAVRIKTAATGALVAHDTSNSPPPGRRNRSGRIAYLPALGPAAACPRCCG